MNSILIDLEKNAYKELPLYQKRIFWTIVSDVMQQDDTFFQTLLKMAKNKVEEQSNEKIKIITDERVED